MGVLHLGKKHRVVHFFAGYKHSGFLHLPGAFPGNSVRIAFWQYQQLPGHDGRFSTHFIDWVVRNNYHTDVNGGFGCYPVGFTIGGGQSNPKNHFDNPNDGPMYTDAAMTQRTASYSDGQHDDWIQDALNQINVNRNEYRNVMMLPNGGLDISPILSAFGQNTHALADFYAHTN